VSKGEQSLRLGEAARLVKRTIGCTLGATREILCMARNSRELRLWGDASNRDWQGIDPAFEYVRDSSGLSYYGVTISADDLRGWLALNRDWLRQEYAIARRPSHQPRQEQKGTDTPANTVAFDQLKSAIKQHGRGSEAELTAHAAAVFPHKRVPRALLRKARDTEFGKPGRGRPKTEKQPQ
jgi:hypothetical protein